MGIDCPGTDLDLLLEYTDPRLSYWEMYVTKTKEPPSELIGRAIEVELDNIYRIGKTQKEFRAALRAHVDTCSRCFMTYLTLLFDSVKAAGGSKISLLELIRQEDSFYLNLLALPEQIKPVSFPAAVKQL